MGMPLLAESNRAILRRFFDQLTSRDNAVDEIVGADLAFHGASTTIHGIKEFKEIRSSLLKAFSDQHYKI